MKGYKTVVIDFDVGLRNLDLIMGCERRVVYDLINVVNGEAKLAQALIKDKRVENLSILPASQTRDKEALNQEGVQEVLNELKKEFEYIICDSPAGIEKGALMAMYFADQAIIVTNGSSDDAFITSLASASNGLSNLPNVHLAVIGISPKHRAGFSKGFTAIRNRVQFAGTDEEIDSFLRALGE